MPVELLLTVLILILIAGFSFLFITMRQMLSRKQSEKDLEEVVNLVFGKSIEKVSEQSKRVLEGEREVIKTDLENKHKQLSKLVKDLEDDLGHHQQDLKMAEKERTQEFGELRKTLEQQRRVSDELAVSTRELKKVLDSNQQRGGWGERIIEDLFDSSGLVEGVHYVRQKSLGSTDFRPDVTLLLPEQRTVAVDVKFPFSELQKLNLAETAQTRKPHEQQFARDLKTKIDKVAEYISPESGTLDYAIMFVPNEAVFAFINQRFPGSLDYAFGKRVMLVSPMTFMIVTRTVMESYRNFMIGGKLRQVLGYVDQFTDEWLKFRDQFSKYGRSIETLQKSYLDLESTRVKQMERRIDKVKEIGSGQLLEEGKK